MCQCDQIASRVLMCALCVCDRRGEEKDRENKNILKLVVEKFSKFDENCKCADSKNPKYLNISNKEKNTPKYTVPRCLKLVIRRKS